jgi:hypothetical protein
VRDQNRVEASPSEFYEVYYGLIIAGEDQANRIDTAQATEWVGDLVLARVWAVDFRNDPWKFRQPSVKGVDFAFYSPYGAGKVDEHFLEAES